jgi:hypothetical protein
LIKSQIAIANQRGEICHDNEIATLDGTYVAAEAGFALAGGMGGMVLRNQNGVVMHVHSTTRGARLQLGTSGLSIKLKQ